ncbi:MAG: response regulator transcription factor [Dehalococcoidia bacterium]
MASARILVVDDEQAIGRLLRLQLGFEGFEVLTALDADQALALATAERPDLLIVDLVLPGADGATLIERLRALTVAPIIVMSGYVDAAHKDLAMDAGATEFITKPFDGDVLAALCRSLLDLPC